MFLSGAQFRIARIGGHEIRLDLIAFGLLGLMVYMSGWGPQGTLAFLAAAFLSILGHELGHAAAIRKITGEHTLVVIGFGGATISSGVGGGAEAVGRSRAGRQVLISLAGPAAQIAVGLAGWAVARSVVPSDAWLPGSWLPWDFDVGASIWLLALQQFIWISVVWSVLNLAPMLPLDGGQALRGLLVFLGGAVRPVHRVTRIITIVLAVALGIWAYDAGYRIALVLLLFFVVLPTMDEARREGW